MVRIIVFCRCEDAKGQSWQNERFLKSYVLTAITFLTMIKSVVGHIIQFSEKEYFYPTLEHQISFSHIVIWQKAGILLLRVALTPLFSHGYGRDSPRKAKFQSGH